MMAEIEKVIYESLRNSGVSDPGRITRIVSDGLRREYCGTSVYIDRNFQSRNECIKNQVLSGADIRSVAKTHSITPHRVKRIVKGWK